MVCNASTLKKKDSFIFFDNFNYTTAYYFGTQKIMGKRKLSHDVEQHLPVKRAAVEHYDELRLILLGSGKNKGYSDFGLLAGVENKQARVKIFKTLNKLSQETQYITDGNDSTRLFWIARQILQLSDHLTVFSHKEAAAEHARWL